MDYCVLLYNIILSVTPLPPSLWYAISMPTKSAGTLEKEKQMDIKAYATAVWEKHNNGPEYLERVSVSIRDWDKWERGGDPDQSLIREHSANGALASLSTERDIYNYIHETLEMFKEEGIQVPDVISYNIERNHYQDLNLKEFDIF